ncbi:hypothetical protein ACL9RL_13855 [Plantibacter sp. Mn2098]|uniref:hypothetical protein n=1 Tax=Plantibacter sp. Mn2098 TaxID=3395266 RepID=UPI003BBF3095
MTRSLPSNLPEPYIGIGADSDVNPNAVSKRDALQDLAAGPGAGARRRPIATAVGSNLGVAVAAMLGVLLIAILAASPARAAGTHIAPARIAEPMVAPRIADVAPWLAGPGMIVAAAVLVLGVGALLVANRRPSRSR